jgi:hypothetical protein
MIERQNKISHTLITGASSGIGRALAVECASRGQNLYLIDLPGTGLSGLSTGLSELYGVHTAFLETDLTGQNTHQEIFDHAKSQDIDINILINNVGSGHNGNLEYTDDIKITSMILLNMDMTTLLCKIFLPMLKEKKQSYILNVCSLAAFAPLPGKSVYAASKAFVLFLSKALNAELRQSGISVSAVFPAGVPTNDLVKKRISQSSRIAKFMVTDPDLVARKAIDGMLKRKEIIFPGRRIKAVFYASSLIPQGLILRFMSGEFKRAPQ